MQADLGKPGTGVIITGGASGIGRACAEALAAVGRPVALWDIQAEAVESVAAKLSADYGIVALGQVVDVSDPAAINAAAELARATLPSIGGFVHAAGVVLEQPVAATVVEDWDRVLNINLRALVLGVQALLPDLRANPGSAVVGIASINGTLGNALIPSYTASKGGMLSVVRSLADDLGNDGIRINSVSPGQILTPMMQTSIDALPPGTFERRVLLGRLGEPREIGSAVRFLLSAEASYITASELVVDGGNISSQRM